MQALPSAPPVASGNTNDDEVLELLRRFRRRLHRSEPADLVVILQYPCARQNYRVSFERLIIKFATRGARSTYTVIVLDAFSSKPLIDQAEPSDEECKDLTAEVLRLKRPRVLLCCCCCCCCCWSENSTSHWVDECRSGRVGSLSLPIGTVIEDQPAVIVRSFHPAPALYWNNCNAKYRFCLCICRVEQANRAARMDTDN